MIHKFYWLKGVTELQDCVHTVRSFGILAEDPMNIYTRRRPVKDVIAKDRCTIASGLPNWGFSSRGHTGV